ncbi:hypothetical protein [Arthrobacter sp. B2a2-09]|uniref:hypothetical protein n=1 Tax=Arthrobacter sp. B2a2-09 TaxID=2952822 RepID=UPI0022CD3EA5|nr:hypothetical protein [Arthrobacter sp. B2a2-09]MCZ9883721.1 hypothetical protein [Arthrobacter sp. B2a2-09]
MTTLTAVPDPSTGSIQLSITQTNSVTKITRSDANGIAEVRVAAGQLPSASTGTTIVTDYEAASGVCNYTVTTTNTSDIATASTTLTLAKPWLMVPIAPNYSSTVETVTNYGAGRSSNSTVHQIIGRADPLVVLGKLGTRTGTLEIWTDSIASANALARVFDRGEIVMLKQGDNAGMDMYFTADDLDISPYSVAGAGLTRYKFTVRYREVVRPYGNLAGALGWTFDALASRYSTFDQILADYATFDALTLGGI